MRLTCKCGQQMDNHMSPNNIELIVYTDKEWDEICSADSIEPWRIPSPQYNIWRCPACKRIYCFEGCNPIPVMVYYLGDENPKIDLLLSNIEERPELFIGSGDIHALRHFLAGYILAMEEQNPSCYDKWLSGFTAYLAQKYDDNRDYDWATLIAAHEADGGTTDAFFRLWSEYRTRSNGS